MVGLVTSETPHRRDREADPKRAGRMWPLLIVGLILGQFSAAGILIWFAVSDPTFAVEPNYYQKALHWDDTARQLQENRTLGWKQTLEIADHADAAGMRGVKLALADRGGLPVADARVSVEFFFHSDSGHRTSSQLTWDAAQSTYVGSLPLGRMGAWELRFDVSRGDERFTFTDDRFLP